MEVTSELITKWFSAWTKDLLTNKAYLDELDTPIGDSDHGTNMARGAEAIQNVLADNEGEDVQKLMKKIAMAVLTKVSGASGAIYGTAFLQMSQKTELTDMIDSGVAGIQRRGQAELGDKTLLDVWIPAADLLKEDTLTVSKIEQDVVSTKMMPAKKGRAKFVGDAAIGHIDPGAVSSGYLFKDLIKEING